MDVSGQMHSRDRYRQERDRLRAEIERNRTPEEQQRADELRARRAAYDALPGDAKKEINELQVFRAFAKIAPIGIEANSELNVVPPEPDICCSVDGSPYYFELGEITDQGVARNYAIALKTDEPTGGAFSQDMPFAAILSSKATKTYVTSGVPVDLLLYYRKQYPPWERDFAEIVNASARDLHVVLKQNGGPFNRLWIFDFWEDRILLCS
jgi:hypothetical protein